MDNVGQMSQSRPQKVSGAFNSLKIKSIAIYLVLFTLGGILGFVLSSVTKTEPAVQEETNPVIEVKETITKPDPTLLNDPIELLDSTVFTEWLGTVEGTVTEKTDISFTIENQGEQLEIFIKENFTTFFEQSEDGEVTELPFAEIVVGDVLRGGVTVSRGTLTGVDGQHVVANAFNRISEQ